MRSPVRTALLAALASLALVPAGCAREPEEAPPPAPGTSLAGTTWRLVEIRTGDEALGVLRPADPARYTLRLDEGGRAEMQLDCNRGAGKWTSRAEPGAREGVIEIGPLATTRALCPPPSIGEELGRDMARVRAFRMESDRLHLELVGNGGSLVWEPE